MDDTPQPRRSFWRFSLRELLLVMLAAGLLLGWGKSLFRRYHDIIPTPFAAYVSGGGLGEDVAAALQEQGAAAPDQPLRSGAGTRGPSSTHSELNEELQLPDGATTAFVDRLFQRVRRKIAENDCEEYRIPQRSSTESDEGFSLHYRRGTTAGSILVVVIRIDEQRARLIAALDEHRAP